MKGWLLLFTPEKENLLRKELECADIELSSGRRRYNDNCIEFEFNSKIDNSKYLKKIELLWDGQFKWWKKSTKIKSEHELIGKRPGLGPGRCKFESCCSDKTNFWKNNEICIGGKENEN